MVETHGARQVRCKKNGHNQVSKQKTQGISAGQEGTVEIIHVAEETSQRRYRLIKIGKEVRQWNRQKKHWAEDFYTERRMGGRQGGEAL